MGVVEHRPARRDCCGFIPANSITLLHFSVSAVMCLPNPAGKALERCAARLGKPSLILESSSRAALISLLASMVSAGVFLARLMPAQALLSNPTRNPPRNVGRRLQWPRFASAKLAPIRAPDIEG